MSAFGFAWNPAGIVVSLSSASSSLSFGKGGRHLGDRRVGPAHVGRPDAAHRLGLRVEVALARLLERPLERRAALLRDRVGLLARDLARRDQARDVDLAHRRLLVDERVHQRLREARLVALVVAVLAVAVHVDDDVLLEALAELHREARDLDDGLGSSPFTWKTGTRSIRAMSVQ